MMKSVAAISLFATATLAASSSLIPTGISSDCSAFLTKLNANTTVSACTTPLISATAAFSPTSATAASAAGVTTALTTLCATNTASACSEPMLRGVLAGFYAACTPELTGSANAAVVRMYDTIYMLTPFYDAVCTKNDAGQFCAAETAAVASASASASAPASTPAVNGVPLASVQQYLGATEGGATVPNATTFASSNVAFLFLQSSLGATAMCTTCTRNILAAYISWETAMAYAPGLPRSQLLVGQTALYNSITSTCGPTFLNSAVQAAGSLGSGLTGSSKSAAVRASVGQAGALASAFGALIFGVVAVL